MTWREGLESWRAWARRGNDIKPSEASRADNFYRELAKYCGGRSGGLDDDIPTELAHSQRNGVLP